jgi:plastocyanin
MKVWSRSFAVLVVAASVTACGGSEQTATAEPSTATAAVEAPSAVATTGEVIEVRMTMANGGRFEPETVTAGPGDVIRFINVENVHNVSFPAAKNSGFSRLPAASPYMTAPGETWDLVVDLEPGSYTFQCDPHVPMGMFGTLTVR